MSSQAEDKPKKMEIRLQKWDAITNAVMYGSNVTQSTSTLTMSSATGYITGPTKTDLTVSVIDQDSIVQIIGQLAEHPHVRSFILNAVEAAIEKKFELQTVRHSLVEREHACKSDDEAEIEIREYLTMKKESGTTRINLLDLMLDLDLPPEQIERIMNTLSKEGVKDGSTE